MADQLVTVPSRLEGRGHFWAVDGVHVGVAGCVLDLPMHSQCLTVATGDDGVEDGPWGGAGPCHEEATRIHLQ